MGGHTFPFRLDTPHRFANLCGVCNVRYGNMLCGLCDDADCVMSDELCRMLRAAQAMLCAKSNNARKDGAPWHHLPRRPRFFEVYAVCFFEAYASPGCFFDGAATAALG